jgi:class 3 adenylate cyclase
MLTMSQIDALFPPLRQSADSRAVAAIEHLLREAPDRALHRVNVLAFAKDNGVDEEQAIAAFLHATRLGLFEMSWNVLCPACGGVLDAGTSLKSINRVEYRCAFCAMGYEPTLDEIVEVTFTVSPRLRQIAGHDPHSLPVCEYCRQMFWSSGVDLPEDLEMVVEEITLEALELPPGEKAILSLQLPEKFIIIFDPVSHATQFVDVKGETASERQSLSLVFGPVPTASEPIELRPGPVRLSLENHRDVRLLPTVWIADERLHDLVARRRPYLTAKRLLTNQTFRDLYRTDMLDVDQRLKITSMTFLFTDLRGSTELYERVGDLAAYDLVQAHFRVLTESIVAEAGAVVKTIGDAVMATFATPRQAIAAALRMREGMHRLNEEQQREDLSLKIGIHEGPCLAVTLNDRQDYFGQTVNVAARVQDLADAQAILATGSVIREQQSSELLKTIGVRPVPRSAILRGIPDEITLYEVP